MSERSFHMKTKNIFFFLEMPSVHFIKKKISIKITINTKNCNSTMSKIMWGKIREEKEKNLKIEYGFILKLYETHLNCNLTLIAC